MKPGDGFAVARPTCAPRFLEPSTVFGGTG
jgi:hypothetical protein